ncbi:MAG TPA: prolyl oligopeptidase family serine peptidase, partial [Thermoanaerobaculia bacterium]|nr:prolyl oligopeptidase family serine peptidase [Thermoanaerobaculia bacterium]
MRFRIVPLLILVVAAPVAGEAAGYQRPPESLARLVDAPLTPFVQASPDRATLLLLDRAALPPVAEVAEPELRLAGLRINPRIHAPSRASSFDGLRFVAVRDGRERRVEGLPAEPPAKPRIRNVAWAPDGTRIAFTLDTDSRVELWTADLASARARRLLDAPLNDAYPGSPFHWLSSSSALLVRLRPADPGEAPAEPRAPEGPVVQENLGRTAPARTYQDLLKSPHDERLFDHYATAELARIGVDGAITKLGRAGVIAGFEPSPDGRFILLESLHRPYSYLVPHFRFPRRVEILDADGRVVRELVDLPLREEVPLGFGSVPTGMRSISWRSDQPATLWWVEALDEGNARREAALRDRVSILPEPFEGEPRVLIDLPLRLDTIWWGDDDLAVVSEWWWSDRKERWYALDPSEPGSEPKVLADFSFEDRYGDPGDLVRMPDLRGRPVLLIDRARNLYLSGDGGSPEGDRPFFRRLDPRSGRTTELFRSSGAWYEEVVTPLDSAARVLLTRRESKTSPPNYFARDVRRNSLRPLTSFPHPYPELEGVQKELITYSRDDGLQLSAVLYLPPGYDARRDGPLPGFVWAYPNEYKDAAAAAQIQDSPHRFNFVSYWGPIPWVTRGYVVIDDAAMPVVGEGEVEPNDSFVDQLGMNARAVIAEGVRRGVLDPKRVGVGGHSYGAFMTGNLLAHTDVFRAGIARSGAYNRSLTPFGFQAEERTFWEAPSVYATMSPFMSANRINEPILLIHGEADNNSGTFPMQSERLYNALKGMGRTTRLVMLPHESHG